VAETELDQYPLRQKAGQQEAEKANFKIASQFFFGITIKYQNNSPF
jgi:hypothetical protein